MAEKMLADKARQRMCEELSAVGVFFASHDGRDDAYPTTEAGFAGSVSVGVEPTDEELLLAWAALKLARKCVDYRDAMILLDWAGLNRKLCREEVRYAALTPYTAFERERRRHASHSESGE